MKVLSLVGFGVLLAAVLCLWQIGGLFSRSPGLIAIQLAAILLMLWACDQTPPARHLVNSLA